MTYIPITLAGAAGRRGRADAEQPHREQAALRTRGRRHLARKQGVLLVGLYTILPLPILYGV